MIEYGCKGEGCRGGRVIGHTQSGKAIYSVGNEHEPSTKGWSKQDHVDAASAYEKISHSAAFSSAMMSGYSMRHGGDPDKERAMQDLDKVGSAAKKLARDHQTRATLMGGKEVKESSPLSLVSRILSKKKKPKTEADSGSTNPAALRGKTK